MFSNKGPAQASGSETLVPSVTTSGTFSKTSDTSYADVTDLAITLPATGQYWVDVMLPTSANASGGVKVQLAGATFTVKRGYVWASGGVTAGSHITTAVLYAVTTSVTFITARVLIDVTDISTPLKLQMAQNASNGAASTISSGAVMSVVRVS